jgi:sulfate permease, SulP family
MNLALLRREFGAGISTALVALPICISSGVLAYAPLGGSFIEQGAAAGLTGGALAALISALVAGSSFVMSTPRASISLIQGNLAAFLLTQPAFLSQPQLIIDAMSICGLLAGLWQILFGLFGIERIIKCTPHPALAGFINGIALLVIFGQLALLMGASGSDRSSLGSGAVAHGLAMPIFAVIVAGFILYLSARAKRLPAMVIGLAAGCVLFYAVRSVAPAEMLGPSFDDVARRASLNFPFASLLSASGRAAFLDVVPGLLITSLVLALVAALESLLAYRLAENLSDQTSDTGRNVLGQGVGNFVSALVGGLASAASSSQVKTTYEAGGRSRLSVLIAVAFLMAVGSVLPVALSFIPVVVVWAVLLAVGLLLFDEWSVRSLIEALFPRTRAMVLRGWKNLLVMATVTVITASGAVVGGTLVGIGLSGILFISDMSRSIVRRRYRGDEVLSKRVRPSEDLARLRESGQRRAILELDGVMFFGNADELARELDQLFSQVDMLLLDLDRVDDIDFSAAAILRHAIAKAARRGKILLLSGATPDTREMLTGPQSGGSVPASAFLPDVDTALEWMEEETLRRETRSAATSVPLREHEFLRGLTDDEFGLLAALLRPRRFAVGAVVCREGDDADEMWILTRGSVSVRLRSDDGALSRRVRSLGVGTVVGEMALMYQQRSATVVADEDVESYALAKSAYVSILRDHPAIAAKLLANILHDTMERLRTTSDQLRVMGR